MGGSKGCHFCPEFLFAKYLGFFCRRLLNRLRKIVETPGFFNLTASFRSDSDLHTPYFYTKRRSHPCKSCVPKPEDMEKKRDLMGWFVSHCVTHGKRERYMARLLKYIPVDILGGCANRTFCSGNMSCLRSQLDRYKFLFCCRKFQL